LVIWPRAPTLIKYRLQSHPSLLRAVLRSAYLAVLSSLALLVGTSQLDQGYPMPTMPNHSMMTRSGLCASTMTSARIDLPPRPAVHPSHSTAQLYSCLQGQTSGNHQCNSGRNCAFRSTFPGPMCVYNGQEHGTASASICSYKAGN
jgi:hypothetical protein